jgi:hypothetical protein
MWQHYTLGKFLDVAKFTTAIIITKGKKKKEKVVIPATGRGGP